MTPIYACQNCEWKGTEAELAPYSDMEKRLEPGDTVPEGECPECGACCWPEETPADIAAEKARQAGPALLAALQGLVAAVVDGEGSAVLLALSQAQMAIEEATK